MNYQNANVCVGGDDGMTERAEASESVCLEYVRDARSNIKCSRGIVSYFFQSFPQLYTYIVYAIMDARSSFGKGSEWYI